MGGALTFAAGFESEKGDGMRRTGYMNLAFATVALCAALAIPARSQTYSTLTNFTDLNNEAEGPLIQGPNGDLYGTTHYGGMNAWGDVYDISTAGGLNAVYSFCPRKNCLDGSFPNVGMVLGGNGNFYGTTGGGGTSGGYGTVFQLTPTGSRRTLHSFSDTDGAQPATVLQAPSGILYGIAEIGGITNGGTVFSVTHKGTFTTIYKFCSQTNCTDGSIPIDLIQAFDGSLYGVTADGGTHNVTGGTVFKVSPSGTLTSLYSFCALQNCADGEEPLGLAQGSDGNFYGVTNSGGANNGGTVFKITSAGQVTTLYNFCSQTACADGQAPVGSLVQGTDGNFYGVTNLGGYTGDGTLGYGVIFRMTPQGGFTTLYTFCSGGSGCTDGSVPQSGLVQATDGNFYGTTWYGGAGVYGVVYKLSVGLGPFIQAVPMAGKVGAKIIILGNGLTGTSAVTFNGTDATFTVVSDTEITAMVPIGATTGAVQVNASGGTLQSNVQFHVIP